jgi:hypothetical protein
MPECIRSRLGRARTLTLATLVERDEAIDVDYVAEQLERLTGLVEEGCSINRGINAARKGLGDGLRHASSRRSSRTDPARLAHGRRDARTGPAPLSRAPYKRTRVRKDRTPMLATLVPTLVTVAALLHDLHTSAAGIATYLTVALMAADALNKPQK